MAIKENIGYIKNELSSQEQFLENAIRSERFFKKNKKNILSIAAILVVLFAIYLIFFSIKSANLDAANRAYMELLSDSNNTNALKILKEKSPHLFGLFALENFRQTSDETLLNEALSLKLDDILKNLILNAKNEPSGEILANYGYLLSGYEFLKNDKINEAKIEFAKIPNDSSLLPLKRSFEHYQGQ